MAAPRRRPNRKPASRKGTWESVRCEAVRALDAPGAQVTEWLDAVEAHVRQPLVRVHRLEPQIAQALDTLRAQASSANRRLLIDPATLAWVGVVAFAAAVMGGLGGFGTGVILTAVLIPIVGVKAVLPVLTVRGVITNAARLFFYRDAIEWRLCRMVLVTALPAMLAGVWVFAVLPARTLQVLLAVFIAGVIPLRRWAAHRSLEVGRRGVVIGGGVFGFLSGIVSGTGVFLISLLLATGLPGAAIIATDAAISLVNDAVKLAVFGGYALIDRSTFATGILIGAITIPGSWCARWLTRRMSAHLHIAFIEALLLVAAMWLIVSALLA